MERNSGKFFIDKMTGDMVAYGNHRYTYSGMLYKTKYLLNKIIIWLTIDIYITSKIRVHEHANTAIILFLSGKYMSNKSLQIAEYLRFPIVAILLVNLL